MEPPLPLRNEVRFGLPKNCFENEPLLSRVGNLTWIPAVWGVFSKGPDFVYIYVLQRIPAEPKAVQGCLSRLQSAHTNGRHSCIHVRTSVYQEIDTKSLLAFTKRHSLPTAWNISLKKSRFPFFVVPESCFSVWFLRSHLQSSTCSYLLRFIWTKTQRVGVVGFRARHAHMQRIAIILRFPPASSWSTVCSTNKNVQTEWKCFTFWSFHPQRT